MRVLLCRAREDAESTALRLAAAGHEAVLAPVSQAVDLPIDLPARLPDALVMTSSRAPAALPRPQVDRLARVPVYAVGDRTAAAARERGFRDVRVAAGDGAALVDLITLTLPRPACLLYLAGRLRKPLLDEALPQRGYAVTVAETYDMHPAPVWDDDVLGALSRGRIDAVLHYSRQSAERAIEAARIGGVGSSFLALRHLCLSADVAVPLRQASALLLVIAREPTEASLLACLDIIP